MILEGRNIGQGQTGHEAGRQLLEQMYRSYTGREMPAIGVTEQGKPYFTRGNVQFSITHTKHHVFCALSENPIGIDAEEVDRQIKLPLADKILSPEEKKQYDAAEDKRRTLLTFWVLKEAAAKCTGEGIDYHPNKTNFTLPDGRVRETDGCLVAVIEQLQEKCLLNKCFLMIL